MKNLKPLFILLILLPLIAQEFDDIVNQTTLESQDMCIDKGFVLAVEPTRINFEEMWLRIPNQQSKIERHLILNITDELGRKIGYSQLTPPFLAEIAYVIINDQKIVTKIRVLKQYRYTEHSFIKE